MIFVLKYFPRLTASREVTLLPPPPTSPGSLLYHQILPLPEGHLTASVLSALSHSLSVLVSDYVIVDLPTVDPPLFRLFAVDSTLVDLPRLTRRCLTHHY